MFRAASLPTTSSSDANAAGRGKPVVAIGGITLARARELVAAGAAGLAVISDLVGTGDPEGRVRAYVQALGGDS